MKKIYTVFFVFVFIFAAFALSAQPPKREMRATWIAVVNEIDWPRVAGAEAQKNRMIQILDSVKGMVSVTGLSAGIYILQVQTAEGVVVKRIIKQ